MYIPNATDYVYQIQGKYFCGWNCYLKGERKFEKAHQAKIEANKVRKKKEKDK